MGDAVEEFDSLFDYSRVQPDGVVCLDDEDSDASPVPKRQKSSCSADERVDKGKEVLICDDEEEEEDWLVPPPRLNTKASSNTQLPEDSTIKELRLLKEELLSVAKSAEDFLHDVDGSTEKAVSTTQQPSIESASAKSSMPPPSDRAKIVLSIQDKDGVKQFRIYADDKFERLFKLYADKAKLRVESLVFSFDGDKIKPTATPESLDMEDNDIVEVRAKPSK